VKESKEAQARKAYYAVSTPSVSPALVGRIAILPFILKADKPGVGEGEGA
jgi:hypothetical protein